MRLIYKLFNRKQLLLLDSVKQGHTHFGYSAQQALSSHSREDIEYLEQKNLIEVKPDMEWGYAKLYPTTRGNSLGRTLFEKQKTRNRVSAYVEKLSVPVLSGVILALISIFLALL